MGTFGMAERGFSRRTLFIGTAALAATSGLAQAACAGPWPRGTAKTDVGAAQLLVSNWVDHTVAMPAFMQEFPQVKVDYTPADFGAHYTKVKTSAISGTPLDAFWLHDAYVTEYVGSGFVRPVDDLVKRDRDTTEDIYPVALKYHTRQGKPYGVPQNLSVYMIYYDQDRFAEVGVPLPKSDWTIDQWTEAASRITRSGANRAGVILQTDRRGYWMFVKGHGGGWTDESGTRSRLAEPGTITAIQWLKDLLDKQKVAVRPRAGAREWVLLQERQAGMLIALNSESAWNLRKAQLPFKWDLAEPPKGPKGRGTAQAATAWVLGEGGKQLEAAWLFVKWMTGEKGQRLLAQQNALVASRRRVAEDPQVNPPPPANLKATSNAHGYGDPHANPSVVLPTPEKARDFDQALSKALSDIFGDRASVRDALTAADAQVKAQGVVER